MMQTNKVLLERLGKVITTASVVVLALWVGRYGIIHAPVVQVSAQAPSSRAWVGKSWTGDDEAFVSVRKKIDKQVADGQQPQSLLAKYREEAQAAPSNPKKAFAWAYSSRKALNPSLSFEARNAVRAGVQQGLLTAPFPNTYNYARLLFLTSDDDHRLVSTGERLLTRNLNDDEVKIKLIDVYGSQIAVESVKTNYVDVQSEQRALALVQQLIKKDASNPVYHSLLAYVYISAYYAGNFRNPEDGRKAIAADREFLHLGPLNPDSFRIAQGEIKEIQEKLDATIK